MNIINKTQSIVSPAEQFAKYLGLSENNMEHIGEQLEGVDWGNLLKKSLDSLKAYSEGSGVNGTNNSKLNANAAGVESGSPESGSPESGSPESGSPESGSPESGSPESGSPESGSPAGN